MSTQPKALRLADALEMSSNHSIRREAASELRRLHEQREMLLAVLKELQESASYWSEYDVPLGIVDRINAAIAKVEAA